MHVYASSAFYTTFRDMEPWEGVVAIDFIASMNPNEGHRSIGGVQDEIIHYRCTLLYKRCIILVYI
jgi:hypothetical protein